MVTIRLYGALGADFGRRYDLAVESAGEALRALCAQLQGLQAAIVNGAYFVRIGGQDVCEAEAKRDFARPLQDGDVIHIVPEMAGGGKFGQIIAGVVLIVVGFWTGGATSAYGLQLIAAGASLALGGIAQLLVGTPDYNLSQGNDATAKSSAFTNLNNIAPQGAYVPVAYGYMEVGSVVVSQSIESYDLKDEANAGGAVTYRREYFAPVPVDAQHVPDAGSDEVRALNYRLVEVR